MLTEKKQGVLTSYLVNGKPFSSYVTGSSYQEIQNKIQIRGLNETIDSSLMDVNLIPDYKDLGVNEFLIHLPQIIHSACFMALIALKSKAMNVDEILGDEGILHELIHINSRSIPISEPKVEEVKLGFTKLRTVTLGVC